MELINDDCLNALTNIPDKSVNLVIADLPYGQTSNTLDIKIDLVKLWEHFKRVGTDNCAYMFFTTTKFGVELIQSNKEWFRYDLVWRKQKGVGFVNAKKMPMRTHELIYVFYKKLPTYNIDEYHTNQKRKGNDIEAKIGCYAIKRIVSSVYTPRLPTSVLDFDTTNNAKKRFHQTEKPVDLLEYLIKYYSNQGDTVLDATMGSGSTGVACKNLNRNFIGIEMDKTIYDIAVERIENNLGEIKN
jgi:DNA modification methylase